MFLINVYEIYVSPDKKCDRKIYLSIKILMQNFKTNIKTYNLRQIIEYWIQF